MGITDWTVSDLLQISLPIKYSRYLSGALGVVNCVFCTLWLLWGFGIVNHINEKVYNNVSF